MDLFYRGWPSRGLITEELVGVMVRPGIVKWDFFNLKNENLLEDEGIQGTVDGQFYQIGCCCRIEVAGVATFMFMLGTALREGLQLRIISLSCRTFRDFIVDTFILTSCKVVVMVVRNNTMCQQHQHGQP